MRRHLKGRPPLLREQRIAQQSNGGHPTQDGDQPELGQVRSISNDFIVW
jgi:hypothetical protein